MKPCPLTAAIAEILCQGEALLNVLDDKSYTQTLSLAFDSAVGGHYRHCLDHFQCLLEGLPVGEVNYDHRQRDPRIETNRHFALEETRRISRVCQAIPASAMNLPIDVCSKVSYLDDRSAAITSTVGREVTYAVAHAIHHYALLGVMCGLMGIRLPAGFGVAPSTLQHRELAAAA